MKQIADNSKGTSRRMFTSTGLICRASVNCGLFSSYVSSAYAYRSYSYGYYYPTPNE